MDDTTLNAAEVWTTTINLEDLANQALTDLDSSFSVEVFKTLPLLLLELDFFVFLD